nr:MAG TPA: hypothetical protein [Caudoviricetes sp.]
MSIFGMYSPPFFVSENNEYFLRKLLSALAFNK